MNRCVIVGGGEIKDFRYVRRQLYESDYIISADLGYAHCTSMGLIPHLALGDFDSYRGDIAKECEVLRYPVEKNDTDTRLAVKEALKRGYREILMFGMTGGRLDHTLANIQTLVYGTNRGATLCICDKNCWITAVPGGKSISVPWREECSLSVFSYTEKSSGVNLENVHYPLHNAVLESEFPLGVSNHFLPGQEAVISVEKGMLIVVCNKAN